jgi:hypothetical protein
MPAVGEGGRIHVCNAAYHTEEKTSELVRMVRRSTSEHKEVEGSIRLDAQEKALGVTGYGLGHGQHRARRLSKFRVER